MKRQDREWIYRFMMNSLDHLEVRLVLEALPVSIKALDACLWKDSHFTGAVIIDEWALNIANVTMEECGEGFIPFLQDNRPPLKIGKDSVLPSSMEVRTQVARMLSSMCASYELEPFDLASYDIAVRRPATEHSVEAADEVQSPAAKRMRLQGGDDQFPNEQPRQPISEGKSRADLLESAMLHCSEDERSALQALIKAASAGQQVEESEQAGEPRSGGGAGIQMGVPYTFSTPASVGYDVTHLMAKLPPQCTREKVRNMSFAEIRTMLDMSTHLGKETRNEANYQAATGSRLVDAMEDNRLTKLHAARFYPQSLADPIRFWEQAPLRVEHHIPDINLVHVGHENKVAPLAIEKAGDRTYPLQLKFFLRANLNVQQRAPKMSAIRAGHGDMGLAVEENWEDADKLVAIQDAVFTFYVRVMWALFSFDYGPMNLLEGLHHWRWPQ